MATIATTSVLGLVSAAIVAASPAAAQTSPAPADGARAAASDPSLFESMSEIVVSGRKKNAAERVQDVPIAITAVTASTLEAAKIRDLTEVANLAPSVRLVEAGATPGYGSFFIRGAGVTGTIPSNDPAVGTVIDGVPIGLSVGSIGEFFELESVEILRGPQGTLFGKNVTGGAILITTKRPTQDLSGFVTVGGGDFGQRTASGSIGGGLSDTVAVKIAGLVKHTDGFFHNTFDNADIGERTLKIVRPTIVFTPTDALTLTGIVEYGRDRGDGPVAQNVFFPNTTVSATYDPRTLGLGKFGVNVNFRGYNHLDWNSQTLQGVYNLGSGSITSITSRRAVDQDAVGDTDGSPLSIFNLRTVVEQEQFYQELRYAGNPFGTDRVDLTIGASYFDQDYTYSESRDLFSGTTRVGLRGIIDHKQVGVFAQSDIKLTDTFTATLGARYTSETKKARIASLGNCTFALTACTFDFNREKTFSSISPKAGVQWKPNDDLLVYASYTRGFRSGGFNVRNGSPAISAGPYDDETVDALEAGFKSDLVDGRLRLNGAVYVNKFRDLQQNVLDAQNRQTILNAADAEIRGFELDLLASLSQEFTLTAGVGYVDSEFSRFDGIELDGVAGLGAGDAARVGGLRLVQVPKWTTTVTGTYQRELSGIGQLTLRGSWAYIGQRAGNVANALVIVGRTPLPYFFDSYHMVDFTAALDLSRNVTISAAFRNLANERYVTSGTVTSPMAQDFIGAPRSFQVDVTYRF